jgi:nitrilase
MKDTSRRVAVVQAGTALFDTPRTLERMQSLCEAAAADRPQLVVFPEAYVGGYPKGLDFGARLGTRSSAGRDDFARYFDSAIDVPGTETARMGEYAAAMRATLVVGVIERVGATLYCSALFFSPEGALQAVHRKLMPTALERLVWGFGDGSTLAVVDTPLGKAAAAICWENYMPALRSTYYAGGTQLWCAPTVDDRDVWQSTMRHVAIEGRCFVLSACQFLRRADAPASYDCIQGNDPDTVLIRGGSVIVSPLGEILAGPLYGEEGVLTAQIDPADLARGKYDLDVAGHYARPDVFELRVNRAPQAAVVDRADPTREGACAD